MAPSASEQFRLFEGLTKLIDAVDRPCCVLLDDVHRADHESLAMLRHLSKDVNHQATVIIATLRDNE